MSDKYRWCRDRIYYLLRSKPFRIGFFGGAISVLLDIDHPIAYYWLQGLDGRFLHTPVLIGAGTLIIIMCGYMAGLYIKYILRGKING